MNNSKYEVVSGYNILGYVDIKYKIFHEKFELYQHPKEIRFLSIGEHENIVDWFVNNDESGRQYWMIEKVDDQHFAISTCFQRKDKKRYLGISNKTNQIILHENINSNTICSIKSFTLHENEKLNLLYVYFCNPKTSYICKHILKQSLNVILRGHIRDSFQKRNLYDYLHELTKTYSINIYLHTWNIYQSSLSWRELDTDSNVVNEEVICNYFKDLPLVKIIIDDDKFVNLTGNVEGVVSRTLCPVRAWKYMWYGKQKIFEYVMKHSDNSINTLNLRFDLFSNNTTNKHFRKSEINEFPSKIKSSNKIHFLVSELRPGIDNIYGGNIKLCYKLANYFLHNLDSISADYNNHIHQEYLVPIVAKNVEILVDQKQNMYPYDTCKSREFLVYFSNYKSIFDPKEKTEIILYTNHQFSVDKIFLSIADKENEVDFYPVNDRSSRQEWTIEKENGFYYISTKFKREDSLQYLGAPSLNKKVYLYRTKSEFTRWNFTNLISINDTQSIYLLKYVGKLFSQVKEKYVLYQNPNVTTSSIEWTKPYANLIHFVAPENKKRYSFYSYFQISEDCTNEMAILNFIMHIYEMKNNTNIVFLNADALKYNPTILFFIEHFQVSRNFEWLGLKSKFNQCPPSTIIDVFSEENQYNFKRFVMNIDNDLKLLDSFEFEDRILVDIIIYFRRFFGMHRDIVHGIYSMMKNTKKLKNSYKFSYGNLFCVNTKLLKKNNYNFYKNMNNLLKKYKPINFVLERMWYVLFDFES